MGEDDGLAAPREVGWSMAPDWVPHARCWMAWPCREAPWGGGVDEARRAYAQVAQAIAAYEPVTMIARPDLVAMASLYCGPGITILPLPHDDGWIRDVGPSFVTGPAGELAGVTWNFNGWGGLHPDFAQDSELARRILEHTGLPRHMGRLVLEGGAIQVDGEGTCIAGTGPLLDPKRNPGLSKAEAEAELGDRLGAEKMIWLPEGLIDDEAGGHVDYLAVFARPGLVLALNTDDRSDAVYDRLQANLEVLRGAVDARGRTLEIVTVPQPKARQRHDGRRLPLSHLNCYLANGAVIMPSFGGATDKAAAKTFAAAWPGRELVPIDALDVFAGGGGIHHIALGQPATAA
jgi:agmatine deiminase